MSSNHRNGCYSACWTKLLSLVPELQALDSCRDVIERQKTVSYITAYLNNIVPGGKAGEVPSGGFVPSFDGLGRFYRFGTDFLQQC